MLETDAVEVLLVEDNPYDIELTLRALKKNGRAHRVLVVKDGAEALDFLFSTGAYAHRAQESLPRVVLLDLKLPKVSGLEVLRRIKEDERTRNLPVVVLTSSREERDVVESYASGVNSYIVKPVDYDTFVRSVSKIGQYWLSLNEPPS